MRSTRLIGCFRCLVSRLTREFPFLVSPRKGTEKEPSPARRFGSPRYSSPAGATELALVHGPFPRPFRRKPCAGSPKPTRPSFCVRSRVSANLIGNPGNAAAAPANVGYRRSRFRYWLPGIARRGTADFILAADGMANIGAALKPILASDSRLKNWIRRFHGVATKYLDSYLGWFRAVDRSGRTGLQTASFLGSAVGG
jgi:hypothetical protein